MKAFFIKTLLKGILLKTTFLMAGVLLLLNSCVTYYPQSVDIPLISGKGDYRLDVGAFIAPNINPSEKKDSSAISDIGLHTTFSAGLNDVLAVQTYLSIDALLRIHLQAALGLFKAFDNKSVIELYGGVGYGNGYWIAFDGGKDDYLLTFAQFNIGKTGMGNSNIDYGLGLKGGYLFTNKVENSWADNTVYQKDGWTFDPSVFIRFGSKRTKFTAKVTYMWTNTIADEYYYPLSVSFGANFHLGKKYRNR